MKRGLHTSVELTAMRFYVPLAIEVEKSGGHKQGSMWGMNVATSD